MPAVCSGVARSFRFACATPHSEKNSPPGAEDVHVSRPRSGADEALSHADGFLRRDRQRAASFETVYPFHSLRHTAITSVYLLTSDLCPRSGSPGHSVRGPHPHVIPRAAANSKSTPA